MLSLFYLTNRAPSPLASDLTLARYKIWEALAVSEVLYLCEHENIDGVIIAPEVEDADVIEVELRRTTLRLKPERNSKGCDVGVGRTFPI